MHKLPTVGVEENGIPLPVDAITADDELTTLDLVSFTTKIIYNTIR